MKSINPNTDPSAGTCVLITGGCGFIGVNLVDHLRKRGDFHLRILDNLSIGTRDNLLEIAESHSLHIKEVPLGSNLPPSTSDTIQLIIGDIRDRQACSEATKGVDAVIHLAAQAGVIPSIKDPFYDCDVNVLGTLNLLHESVENKVDKFIFASSNAPLGEQTPPSNEEKIPKPLSPYGASKLACEAYCSAFYHSFDLKTIIFRFSNAYGSYSLHKGSVVAKFIKDGILNGKLTIYGDGKQTRDFIHVGDICQAIHTILNSSVLQSSHSDSFWGNVFHLGTGIETSVVKLAELTQSLFDKKLEIVFTPELKGEIKRNYSEITKAKDLFGFDPKIHIEKGVKSVYEWFMQKDYDEIRNAQVLTGSE